MTSVEPVDTASWRRAVGASGLLRGVQRGRGDRLGGCACRAAAQRAGQGDRRAGGARRRPGGAGAARRVGVPGSAVGRGPGRRRRPALARDRRLAGGRVGQSAARSRRTCCAAEEHLLYLDRYWREEEQVADDLRAMVSRRAVDQPSTADIDRLFPAGYEEQRGAAEIALSQRLTVLTGGPGTGKTTTVARLLALFAGQAGSGVAAAHRAGGADRKGGGPASGGRADRRSTSWMLVDQRRHLGAAGDDAASPARQQAGQLVAVPPPPGQPAAARRHRGRRDVDGVVDDDGPAAGGGAPARPGCCWWATPTSWPRSTPGRCWPTSSTGSARATGHAVAALKTSHRFGESIGALASAIRDGDADAALEVLRAGGDHIEWIDDRRPDGAACAKCFCRRRVALRQAAVLGDAATALATLDEQRLLCAHRRGPYGVAALESAGRAVARPRRRASRSGRTGMRAGRCSSPPTTTGSACTTATPA